MEDMLCYHNLEDTILCNHTNIGYLALCVHNPTVILSHIGDCEPVVFF